MNVLCILFSDMSMLLDSASTLVHPMGIVFHDDLVYWTDSGGKDIRWLNVSMISEMGKVIGDRRNLQRITLFHRERPKPG